MSGISHFPLPQYLRPSTTFITSVVDENCTTLLPLVFHEGILAKTKAICERCLLMPVIAGAATLDLILWTSRTILLLPVYQAGLKAHLQELAAIIATVATIPAIPFGYQPPTAKEPTYMWSPIPISMPQWLLHPHGWCGNVLSSVGNEMWQSDSYVMPLICHRGVTAKIIAVTKRFLMMVLLFSSSAIDFTILTGRTLLLVPMYKTGLKTHFQEVAATITAVVTSLAMPFGYFLLSSSHLTEYHESRYFPLAMPQAKNLIYDYSTRGLPYVLKQYNCTDQHLIWVFREALQRCDAAAVDYLLTHQPRAVDQLVLMPEEFIPGANSLLSTPSWILPSKYSPENSVHEYSLEKTCQAVLKSPITRYHPSLEEINKKELSIHNSMAILFAIGYIPGKHLEPHPFNTKYTTVWTMIHSYIFSSQENLYLSSIKSLLATDMLTEAQSKEDVADEREFNPASVIKREIDEVAEWLETDILTQLPPEGAEIPVDTRDRAIRLARQAQRNTNNQLIRVIARESPRYIYSFHSYLRSLKTISSVLGRSESQATVFAAKHYAQLAPPSAGMSRHLWRLVASYGLPHHTVKDLKQFTQLSG
ncbi:MAG: hypothetical protein H0X51_04205 [Parachlamydiaceae bacterium]|nr:hypothetical protein [Parachlamydiaceae bacterium]